MGQGIVVEIQAIQAIQARRAIRAIIIMIRPTCPHRIAMELLDFISALTASKMGRVAQT